MTAASIGEALRVALLTADPRAKVMATRKVCREWRLGKLDFRFGNDMPETPGRPDKPELLAPRHMPRRAGGQSIKGRIALFHALAHIEFVAIDLALDMAGRFGREMGRAFVDDFLSVAADEAMHFALLNRHLGTLGIEYGDFPAHGGLWEAAHETRHDVAARLAIVPMVLEARGLDVTPKTLERVEAAGDQTGVRILQRILDDEIRHVRFGTSHFNAVCQARRNDPEKAWKTLVNRHFRGAIKPPFNDSARQAAGLSRSFYTELAS